MIQSLTNYNEALLELIEAFRVSIEEALDVDVSTVLIEVLLELGKGGVSCQGSTAVHVEARDDGSNFRDPSKSCSTRDASGFARRQTRAKWITEERSECTDLTCRHVSKLLRCLRQRHALRHAPPLPQCDRTL